MESCWRIGPCSHSSFFKDHGLHLRNSLRTRGSLLKIIWRSGRWGISWRVRRGAGLHKNRRTSAVHCSHHSLRRRSSWYPAWVHEDTTGGGKGFRSIVMATSSLVHLTGSCRILVRLTVLVRIHWSCWKITLLCLTADWRQLNLYPWCLDPVISYLALWIGWFLLISADFSWFLLISADHMAGQGGRVETVDYWRLVGTTAPTSDRPVLPHHHTNQSLTWQCWPCLLSSRLIVVPMTFL